MGLGKTLALTELGYAFGAALLCFPKSYFEVDHFPYREIEGG